jgi:Fis family transcriptional regulator, factor for inversion stimulation protein
VPASRKQATPLRDHVQKTIRRYLDDMGNTEPEHVYQKLLAEIEPPLIEEILRFTGGNQSRAARILGMTRNTLRSKLRRYTIKPR